MAPAGVIDESPFSAASSDSVEAANAPITALADAELQARGITVVPDILANAGGVTASYYEWLASGRPLGSSEHSAMGLLERAMTAAHSAVSGEADALGIDLRTAAFVVALRRLQAGSHLTLVRRRAGAGREGDRSSSLTSKLPASPSCSNPAAPPC